MTKNVGNKIKSKLNFILKISNKVGLVKAQLKAPENAFMDDKRKTHILEKIPNNWIYRDGNLVRNILEKKIDQINTAQKNSIKLYNDYIVAELEMNLPQKYNPNFIRVYQGWSKRIIETNHVKEMEKEIKIMASEFQEINKKFNEAFTKSNKLREELYSYMASAHMSFDGFLKSHLTGRKLVLVFKEINCILKRIEEKQSDLSYELYILRDTIQWYNKKRSRWAETLLNCIYCDEIEEIYSSKKYL